MILWVYLCSQEKCRPLSQKTNISRAWVSDPVHITGNVLYRVVNYEQLQHDASPITKLPVYQRIRSLSHLEGFYFRQNWKSPLASTDFFAVTHWNQKRAKEHLAHPYHDGFIPKLTFFLNKYSEMEYGKPRYPDVVFNFSKTYELFGYKYLSRKASNDLSGSILTSSIVLSFFNHFTIFIWPNYKLCFIWVIARPSPSKKIRHFTKI